MEILKNYIWGGNGISKGGGVVKSVKYGCEIVIYAYNRNGGGGGFSYIRVCAR